jgi:hypothetical protein
MSFRFRSEDSTINTSYIKAISFLFLFPTTVFERECTISGILMLLPNQFAGGRGSSWRRPVPNSRERLWTEDHHELSPALWGGNIEIEVNVRPIQWLSFPVYNANTSRTGSTTYGTNQQLILSELMFGGRTRHNSDSAAICFGYITVWWFAGLAPVVIQNCSHERKTFG